MPEEKSSDRDLIRARELEKSAEEVYRIRSEDLTKETAQLMRELEVAQSNVCRESARADLAESNFRKMTRRAYLAEKKLEDIRKHLQTIEIELSRRVEIATSILPQI